MISGGAKRVVLASGSASRRAMLDAAGVYYEAAPADVDEAAIRDAMLAEGAPPREIAAALAEAKARAIAAVHPDAIVIGSDSVVAVDGRLYEKPKSREDAARHLSEFSGREMRLTSAIAVVSDGAVAWQHVEDARLLVRPLSTHFIASYLDAEWPDIAGCVGCFRMEGVGVQLFAQVQGNHFTILGMPLIPLLGYLRECRALAA